MLHMWRASSEQAALAAFRTPITEQGVDWYDYATENNFQGIQTEFADRMSLNDPPSVVQWIVGEEMKRLANRKVFRSIPLDATLKERLHPEVLELVQIGDALAGLPVGIHTLNHAVYNESIAEKYDLGIPETWDELISYGDTLRAEGIYLIAASTEQWQQRKLFVSILSSRLTPEEFTRVMTPGTDLSDLRRKFVDAFRVLRDLKAYANPDSEDARRWEDLSAMVAEGRAFAQILGDYIVPEFPDRAAIVCTGSPGSNFVVWGMDSFVLTASTDPALTAGQDLLIEIVLSPEIAATYVTRKGGVPVTNDVDASNLDPCAAAALATWENAERRIWTGGDVWRRRFSAMGGFAKRMWDMESFDPAAAARRLIDALGKI